jgi:hypothetical protein
MILTSKLVHAFADRPDWFTLTRVTLRVVPSLGAYRLELDSAISESLDELEREGTLGEIDGIHGVLHNPARDWVYAFRVDTTGWHVAVNAPPDAISEATPHLREVVASA